MQPFAHGADLVFHSATKFLSGHGVVIGGLLVDAGRFDWDMPAARGKFPTLTEPYAGFHDMVFAEESTTAGFLLRARREGIRDFGACMAPFTAFQILQGIETLPLRMARHVENTRQVVAFLAAHPLVESVGYPELPGHPDHALAADAAARTAAARCSASTSSGTRAQGRKFIEALRLFSHLANVGDAKSLVIHPAIDDALPDVGGGSRQGGHHRGDDPAVGRPREPRRPDRGPAPRAVRGGQGAERDALAVAGNDVYAYTGARALDAARPTVVFVHGAANDHSVWALQSRYFAHHGCNVLAVDLPGHGRSAGAALASVEALADWIVALLDAAGVEQRGAGRPFAGRARGARVRGAPSRSRRRSSRCSAPPCR